jgi:hypothetical protein
MVEVKVRQHKHVVPGGGLGVHQAGAAIDEQLTGAATQLHATRVSTQALVRGLKKRVRGTGTPKLDADCRFAVHCG